MRLLFLCLLLLVCGCADPNVTPENIRFGSSDTLVMGGNLRTVTERTRVIPQDDAPPLFLQTQCTEPSPDVAIAFGRTLALQASATKDDVSGSGSVNAASTELASALTGRSAGVLALRDGLYAACQSYVNGVIGHDAYALILSQYGDLLIALAGTGENARSAPTAQEAALSALLVACVSAYDQTRLGPKGNGIDAANPLLSRRFCSALLNNIAQGKIMKPIKVAAKKADVDAKPGPDAKAKVISTETTTKTTTVPNK